VPVNVEIKKTSRTSSGHSCRRSRRPRPRIGRSWSRATRASSAASGDLRRTSCDRIVGKEIAVFELLRRLRLSRFLRPSYQALQVPEGYRNILRLVTPSFVRAAHQLGVRVDVWTVNTEPEMRRVLGHGVDGIMTDRPDALNRMLRGEEGARAPSAPRR
jgi:glycerophosphoryl diester phosphodiesterase